MKPEFALIDVRLPDMGGYALARLLKASHDGVPRPIAVSGYGHAEARTRATQAGFDALYREAGATIDQIHPALENVFGRDGCRRE